MACCAGSTRHGIRFTTHWALGQPAALAIISNAFRDVSGLSSAIIFWTLMAVLLYPLPSPCWPPTPTWAMDMVIYLQRWVFICAWEATIWLRRVRCCSASSWKSCGWASAISGWASTPSKSRVPWPPYPHSPPGAMPLAWASLVFSQTASYLRGPKPSLHIAPLFGPQITRPCQVDFVPNVGLLKSVLSPFPLTLSYTSLNPVSGPFLYFFAYPGQMLLKS